MYPVLAGLPFLLPEIAPGAKSVVSAVPVVLKKPAAPEKRVPK